jgi:hypothetical protein
MGIPMARAFGPRHVSNVDGVDLGTDWSARHECKGNGLLCLSAAMLLASPLAGRGSASLFHRAVEPGAEGEDLVPPRGDPDIFMTNHSAGAESATG